MKLIITVRYLCGHYHGRNREKVLEDFPPSPMRLFQALIAAGHRSIYGEQNAAIRDNALRWLENLAPPSIVAGETLESGEGTINYVPNNDNGTKEDRFGHVRTDKSMHRRVLLDDKVEYIWNFDADEISNQHAKAVCAMARLVTYLGQTTDLAVAHGAVAEDFSAAEDKFFYEPTEKKGKWQVPSGGSLQACQERYNQRKNSVDFPTPAGWVNYRNRNAFYLDAPTALFELKKFDGKRWSFEPQLLQQPSAMMRHAWLKFLRENPAFAEEYGADLLTQKIAGHESAASGKSVNAPHVAFVPIPSLNKDFLADGKISRVLVIGYGCEDEPHRRMFYDIAEKLDGQSLIDEQTEKPAGEMYRVAFKDDNVIYRFRTKPEQDFKVWRTVTPIILSGHIKLVNAEIETGEKTKVFKKGRSPEDLIIKALREAGIPLELIASVNASKSPLVPKTKHAFRYKPCDRLNQFSRYHAEVEFKKPLVGSLVIGRGRFAGFGLLMPWR
jgi:CRISPR-associated protein Csb2